MGLLSATLSKGVIDVYGDLKSFHGALGNEGARKATSRETFTRLLYELRQTPTLRDLDDWWLRNWQLIEELPFAWPGMLADAMEDHKEDLAAQADGAGDK